MPLTINLRQLEEETLQLKGELPVIELELESLDELIRVGAPLEYDLEAQKMEEAVLVQGTLTLKLDCDCVRCLKRFTHTISLEEWACHLPLQGDDAVSQSSDSVDLTPYLREDIVLAFPQHPLCDLKCSGLAGSLIKKVNASKAAKPDSAATWAALDKLKLRN
jgi:uncharacterized protein